MAVAAAVISMEYFLALIAPKRAAFKATKPGEALMINSSSVVVLGKWKINEK